MNQMIEKAVVKPGDIFYSSWGYDQTNIDFYKIVRATDKTVWIQEIEKEYIKQVGWAHYDVKPSDKVKIYSHNVRDKEGNIIGNKEVEAPVIKRKLNSSGDYTYVKISSFEFANPWDRESIMETHTC